MLVLNILPICQASGIAKPFTWLRKHGVTHNMAHALVSGTYQQPPLSLIEKLCLLLGCVPHDLLSWHPEKGQPADVPLGILLHKEAAFDWVGDIDKLPPEMRRVLGEKLREMQSETDTGEASHTK